MLCTQTHSNVSVQEKFHFITGRNPRLAEPAPRRVSRWAAPGTQHAMYVLAPASVWYSHDKPASLPNSREELGRGARRPAVPGPQHGDCKPSGEPARGAAGAALGPSFYLRLHPSRVATTGGRSRVSRLPPSLRAATLGPSEAGARETSMTGQAGAVLAHLRCGAKA